MTCRLPLNAAKMVKRSVQNAYAGQTAAGSQKVAKRRRRFCPITLPLSCPKERDKILKNRLSAGHSLTKHLETCSCNNNALEMQRRQTEMDRTASEEDRVNR